jgi:hypothetical protein
MILTQNVTFLAPCGTLKKPKNVKCIFSKRVYFHTHINLHINFKLFKIPKWVTKNDFDTAAKCHFFFSTRWNTFY